MQIEEAYHILFGGSLIWLGILISAMLIRSVIGPRITDRLLSINMIGTMISCSILILSSMLNENYLADIALLYAMISFVSVLILTRNYIPGKPVRGKFYKDAVREMAAERKESEQYKKETGRPKAKSQGKGGKG